MRAAVVFPGQGSQFVGMADAWATHPAGRAVLEEASAGDGTRRRRGLPRRGRARDHGVRAAGPAGVRRRGVPGAASATALRRSSGWRGIRSASSRRWSPRAMLASATRCELVVIRGAAMQRAGEDRPGTMTALLGVGADDARRRCATRLAATTCWSSRTRTPPHRSVISGSVAAIERAEALAAERKIRAVRLNVAGAFHSPLMDRRSNRCRPRSRTHRRSRAPRFPIAENVTGDARHRPRPSSASPRERHVVSPVRWEASVGALAGAGRRHVPRGGPGRRAHEAHETGRARGPGRRGGLARGRGRARRGRDLSTHGGGEPAVPRRAPPAGDILGHRRGRRPSPRGGS